MAKTKKPVKLQASVGRGGGTGIGRFRKIETPEQLWQYFVEYRQWCLDNPFKKHVGYKGKGGKIKVYVELQRPLIFRGFEGYLAMREIVADLSNYEKRDDAYHPIIKQIRKECSLETIGGAMTGTYNSNLAARLEGLVDKSEMDVKADRKDVGKLFPFKPK